ncbi:MAG: cytochrome-c peroxidase [Fluviicola sp.]|nr:cytochrome-c peroxidase [Fluviicola sp.]
MKRYQILGVLVIAGLFFTNCKKDPLIEDVSSGSSGPTPYNLITPNGFPFMNIPADNPLTVEGVSLGRRLFYDPILSGDNTQSCASCHTQAFSFSDNGNQFSTGIDGFLGGRNSPAIINAGWSSSLFWDGRAASLEEQALGPVPNPIEMHLTWTDAMVKLNAHPDYPTLFSKAFGTISIDSILVAKAIAQFERTLISNDSKWDKYLRGEASLTASEARGFDIFFTEKGDCFHCHSTILFTDNLFHNNGLDDIFTDIGLGAITGSSNDNAKFKSPTLRNVEFTAPYMHDGRFNTLEEVITFYSEGVKFSPTISPLMKKVAQGGLQLNPLEKQDLLSFLRMLSDTTFVNNPDYSDPF